MDGLRLWAAVTTAATRIGVPVSVRWGNRRGMGASHVKDLGLVLGAGGSWLSEEPHGWNCILKDSLWLTWVEGRREAGVASGEPQSRWERPDESGRGKARRDRFPLLLSCASTVLPVIAMALWPHVRKNHLPH